MALFAISNSLLSRTFGLIPWEFDIKRVTQQKRLYKKGWTIADLLEIYGTKRWFVSLVVKFQCEDFLLGFASTDHIGQISLILWYCNIIL